MSYKTWHIVRHVEVNIPQCKPPARVFGGGLKWV